MITFDFRLRPSRQPWLGRALCAAAVLAAGYSGAGLAQWQPTKNVEIIVNTSPGGGLDQFARFLHKLIQSQRTLPVTSSVVNKPGGGGTIGLVYLNQHAGDGHYVMVATPTFLTNHILGRSNISVGDVTIVTEMFSEYVAIMVRADSPLKDGRDLVAALRKDPAGLSIGIATSLGNHNHTGIALPLKAAGVDVRKLRAVIFNSVADANTALLGGHIDVVPTPPGNVVALAGSGKIRGLAISAPARISGPYANVPTWKELGIDRVASTTRNVLGPKGMPPEQVAFWEAALSRIAKSPEWAEDLERRLLNNTFKLSAEVTAHMRQQYEELKQVLTDLGMVTPK
ncbi:MAG: tripartite tricarboxylate transporter substrate binding protein [Betaproteobacteria bacterium]|nr:tripartite tricarboxylate transporter substrate binding protein [Betaproteobacteria bacterium]